MRKPRVTYTIRAVGSGWKPGSLPLQTYDGGKTEQRAREIIAALRVLNPGRRLILERTTVEIIDLGNSDISD